MAYGFNDDKSKYPLEDIIIPDGHAINLATGDHMEEPLVFQLPENLDDYPTYSIDLLLDPETGETLSFYKGDEGIEKPFTIGDDVSGTATLNDDGTLSIAWNNAGENPAPVDVTIYGYPYPALRDIVRVGQASGGSAEFDRKYLGKNWLDDSGNQYLVVIGGGDDDSQFDLIEIQKTNGYIRHNSLSAATRESAAPSSNTSVTGEVFYDANGERVGYNEIMKATNNAIYRSYAVNNEKADGTEVLAALYLNAYKDGTTAMTLSSGTKLDKQYVGGLGTLAGKSTVKVTTPATALDLYSVSGGGSPSVTVTKTIDANTGTRFDLSISTPSGWKFVSVQRITTNHTNICCITGWNVSTNVLYVYVRNLSSSSVSCSVTAEIRYMRVPAMTGNVTVS